MDHDAAQVIIEYLDKLLEYAHDVGAPAELRILHGQLCAALTDARRCALRCQLASIPEV